MREINYDEFIAALLAFGRAVHGELLPDYYAAYRSTFVSGESSSRFYVKAGFAVCLTPFEDDENFSIFCNIHQISDDCSLPDAVDACKKLTAEIASGRSGYESSGVYATVKFPFAQNYADKLCNLHFTRAGEAFALDERVRALDASDADAICAACGPYRENDTLFGRLLAEKFCKYYYGEGCDELVGCFEGDELVGVAAYHNRADIGMCSLNQIFVVPKQRSHGVGAALVKSAMSRYPGVEWLYQAAINNTPSQKLAESLGFNKIGGTLWYN